MKARLVSEGTLERGIDMEAKSNVLCVVLWGACTVVGGGLSPLSHACTLLTPFKLPRFGLFSCCLFVMFYPASIFNTIFTVSQPPEPSVVKGAREVP